MTNKELIILFKKINNFLAYRNSEIADDNVAIYTGNLTSEVNIIMSSDENINNINNEFILKIKNFIDKFTNKKSLRKLINLDDEKTEEIKKQNNNKLNEIKTQALELSNELSLVKIDEQSTLDDKLNSVDLNNITEEIERSDMLFVNDCAGLVNYYLGNKSYESFAKRAITKYLEIKTGLDKTGILNLGDEINKLISLEKNEGIKFAENEALDKLFNLIHFKGYTKEKLSNVSKFGKIIFNALFNCYKNGLTGLENYLVSEFKDFNVSKEDFIKIKDSVSQKYNDYKYNNLNNSEKMLDETIKKIDGAKNNNVEAKKELSNIINQSKTLTLPDPLVSNNKDYEAKVVFSVGSSDIKSLTDYFSTVIKTYEEDTKKVKDAIANKTEVKDPSYDVCERSLKVLIAKIKELKDNGLIQ